MEANVTFGYTLYATLEVLEQSVLDEIYDSQGDIDYNDFYLGVSQMFSSNGTEITPNPNGAADLDFGFDVNGDIEPVSR